jgi:hypothetical protein
MDNSVSGQELKKIMSEKKNAPKELNLGLTEILARGSTTAAFGSQATTGPSTTETTIVTVEDDIQDLNAELSKLAESGQWGRLVGRAESAISSDEDIEARLWWIRGHLGAFTLPVSLLAAPFETVCRQLVGDPRVEIFAELLREIGEISLVRLRDVGDRRQEHAVRLALSRLGILNPDDFSGKAATHNYGKVPPKVPRFELGTAQVEEPMPVAAVAHSGRARRRRVTGFVVALLCLVPAGVFVLQRGERIQQPLMTAPEELLVASHVPGMLLPDVVARPVSSSLGALYYSLNREAASNKEDSVGGKAQARSLSASAGAREGDNTSGRTAAETVRAPTEGRVVPSDRPPAPEERKPREVVRTDGPIEGPDFTRGVQRQRVPQPRLPDVVSQVEPNPLPNLSYPDGSINLGGEIKSTLVGTEVFDSPSYQARTIARLEPGDKVNVEGRVGQWFRIRSQRGRVGFVFSQDIGEAEDFNVGR